MEQQAKKQSIQLNISETMKCGTYANVLAVSINSQEVVLDFGYRAPNQANQITIVSRINLTHPTAKQVISTLQNSLLDFENKKKKQA